LKKFIQGGEVEISAEQQRILTFQSITFMLGSHFNCPPHSWDDQPAQRVLLDFYFVSIANEIKKESVEKMQKDMERKSKSGGGSKGGRPLRTTSDSLNDDFFERINQEMREE
jgi:hypothetical protein